MIVKLIGWLVSRERVQHWLFGMAEEYVGGHLFGVDGDLYMGRWTLIERGSKASQRLFRLTSGRYDHVRIHWIRKPDRDREKHDHPFPYRTFVMDGWYNEEYIDALRNPQITGHALRASQGSAGGVPNADACTRYRCVGKGNTALAPLGQFHRISTVSDGGVWTMFCMGPDHGKWGFLVGGRWVRSHDFFKLRNIGHDGRAL
jgi:hypothetical protein